MKYSSIRLLLFSLVIGLPAVRAQVASGGTYTLNQSVVASGGGASSDATGTVYTVKGTAGQPAAGTISYGGGYVLKGGFWTAAPLGTTAAEVSLQGRVVTSSGRGLMNARVLITGASGQTWTVLTSAFGNFRFDGARAGETVIISVSSKRYTFAPQVVTLTDNVSGLTFTAQ